MPSNLNIDQLLQAMLKAAAPPLQKAWPNMKDYAATEFQKYLIQVQHIQEMKAQGTVSEDQAHFLLDMQKNSMRSVLLTSEGLGLLAVEAAINAALDAVRDTINTAIGGGWKII
jgi:hypothetical protein